MENEFAKALNATHVYVALKINGGVEGFDEIIVELEVDRPTASALLLKRNEYGIDSLPLSGYKEYWALTKEELK